ncbi:hypothetical protein JAAARDRAFT_197903 [Jaapia argillacea MUCL 33604]|uniref:DUF6534 domain-containing protein n=1 Tax=Jaapia argillacea MUCL 33604 TaxID=933084 RepID=A0A067PG48_9AGAM|nr:hypothetical protein JAAARDRAFT_197903 [Jaapia argillacea MUCL 33604]
MSILDPTSGSKLVGIFLNVILYGATLVQYSSYFSSFKDDWTWITSLVFFLFVADTANIVFLISVFYAYAVANFGSHQPVDLVNWCFMTNPLLNIIIAVCIQAFFARRLRVLSRQPYVICLVCFGIVAETVSGIAVVLIGSILPSASQWGEWQVQIPTVIWLVSTASVDSAISVSLRRYFRENKDGSEVMDNWVSELTRSTVHTGMIPAVASILNLTIYLSYPYSFPVLLNLPLAKLYIGFLLSTVNTRSGGRDPQMMSVPRQVSSVNHQLPESCNELVTTPGSLREVELVHSTTASSMSPRSAKDTNPWWLDSEMTC